MISLSTAPKLLFMLACVGMLAGCFKSQDVQTGTETGNPPVIDADLVALVVREDSVHVVGDDGAVSPAGTEVQATSDLTGKVFRARSDAKGAFDIAVEATPSDAFEVAAIRGQQSSSVVYVVRGGASVSEARDAEPDCMERGDLARSRMSELFNTADRSCVVASDCQFASTATDCSDSCSDALVSTKGLSEIETARTAIEAGLCKDFESDGCSVLRLPCPGPVEGTLDCVDGQCVFEPSMGGS